jgi:hypothetical protein
MNANRWPKELIVFDNLIILFDILCHHYQFKQLTDISCMGPGMEYRPVVCLPVVRVDRKATNCYIKPLIGAIDHNVLMHCKASI